MSEADELEELEELQWEAEWELVSVKCIECGIRDYEENMVPANGGWSWCNKFLCVGCETLRRKSINGKM